MLNSSSAKEFIRLFDNEYKSITNILVIVIVKEPYFNLVKNLYKLTDIDKLSHMPGSIESSAMD